MTKSVKDMSREEYQAAVRQIVADQLGAARQAADQAALDRLARDRHDRLASGRASEEELTAAIVRGGLGHDEARALAKEIAETNAKRRGERRK